MTLSGHAAVPRGTVAWYPGTLCKDSATEVDTMPEKLDLRVHDRVALDEIELYAEVLSAVAIADRRLTVPEIDEVLGVRSVPGHGPVGRIGRPPVLPD